MMIVSPIHEKGLFFIKAVSWKHSANGLWEGVT
jgi:hypothetical protein